MSNGVGRVNLPALACIYSAPTPQYPINAKYTIQHFPGKKNNWSNTTDILQP